MATILRAKDLAERVSVLEDLVAKMQRTSGVSIADNIGMFRCGDENYNYDDNTALSAVFENTFTPLGAQLLVGISVFGDQVASTFTGGAWDFTVNGTTVASGTAPANFSIVQSDIAADLSPYLGTEVHVQLRSRRTSGATTGGRFGNGGCVATAIRYARIQ